MMACTPQRYAIIYDGACAFCRRQMESIRRLDRAGVFELVPNQAPGLVDRFPQLANADLQTGLRVVLPDGSVSSGADAVYEIARRLPGRRWVAWLYRVPGLHQLARLAYKKIAQNRYRLSCESGACPVDRGIH